MSVSIRDDTVRAERSSHAAGSDFLKDVIRQHWTNKLGGVDKQGNSQAIAEIETHLSSINQIVDPLDYELFCIPNIIDHSKHMQREEFSKYLKVMESLAVGYSSLIGRDITVPLMIGISTKAKNLKSAERYYGLLTNDLEAKIRGYNGLIEQRRRRIEILSERARTHESSILRFFRKGKILLLRRKVDYGRKRIEKLSRKLDSVSDIHRNVKIKANKD